MPTSASPPKRWQRIPSSSRCRAISGIAACSCRADIRSRKTGTLTLAALARYPIVTYDFTFTGRSQINAAFDAEGLAPNVVLTALDSDVIKTYVELGMGVGIVAQMAYDPERDTAFEKLDAGHLFAPSITRIALRRGAFLRGYIYDFIQLFAPALDRTAVDTALSGAEKPGARPA